MESSPPAVRSFFCLLIPFHVFAATLFIVPASRTLTVGQTFMATVDVSSPPTRR